MRGPDGQPIETLDEWSVRGGPQQSYQWRDGRSAKECARAWLRTGSPAVPAELTSLFDSHPLLAGLRVEEAVAEIETRLDAYGRGRVHDLVLTGATDDRSVVVSVEAKADESFGELVANARAAAVARRPRSRVPDRIEGLRRALFGPAAEVDGLRYQLLYGVAGALIEAAARGADVAVFVVHEFAFPGHVDAAALERNGADFDAAVSALGGAPPTNGHLVEVPPVPGYGDVPAGMPLLIGKARYPAA